MKTLAVLMSALAFASAADKVIFCYLGSWATYRHGNGKFEAENIQPDLCTHIVYAFVGISTSGQVVLLDEYNDVADNYGKNAMGRCRNLKASNPNLKVLVAIGGWNEGSEKYSAVVNNDALRATFVDSIVSFTVNHGFDGFDIDWEYPGLRGGASTDKEAFVKLLKELRPRFDEKGLVLTAAVGAGRATVDTAYDVPSLSKYLDYINVMTYDFHGLWDGMTGQNAPLYPSASDADQNLNVDAGIRNWVSLGADKAKLVLGMGTYGRTFTLTNSNNHGLGAPASNGGNAGKFTATAGTLGYNEFCELHAASPWTVVWDDVQKVPYAYSGNQWIGYDDVRSLTIKSEYIVSNGLAGGMIWSLETDDFLGLCHGYKFPLLSAINKVLNGGGNSPGNSGSDGGNSGSEGGNSGSDGGNSGSEGGTSGSDGGNSGSEGGNSGSEGGNSGSDGGNSGSNSASSTIDASTATESSSDNNNNPSALCNSAGYVRDPSNCQVFYLCQLVSTVFVAHKFVCQDTLVFDTDSNTCNYASAVTC